MIQKPWNNKAWFMVLPVVMLVAFSAVIPLMTVVNYSIQDTFPVSGSCNNDRYQYGNKIQSPKPFY